MLRDAVTWLALGLGLVTLYAYKDDLMPIAARVVGELLPGSAMSVEESSNGLTEVRLRRRLDHGADPQRPGAVWDVFALAGWTELVVGELAVQRLEGPRREGPNPGPPDAGSSRHRRPEMGIEAESSKHRRDCKVQNLEFQKYSC